MKGIIGKRNILKNIYTLVIASILICCSFSTLADMTTDKHIQNIQLTKPSSFAPPKGNITILEENFSNGNMPPTGWTKITTNINGTWRIDSERYISPPNSASVWRGPNCHGLQDEWLISPSLNLKSFYNETFDNKYYLQFYWFTDIYVNQNSLIYFNVSVSTNGGTNWTKIWTAKDHQIPEWTWTFNGMPINISDYHNETNVKIGFQFHSNTELWADAQFFAIDEIDVSTESPVNFSCDAGGPYNWWFYRQGQLLPPGVRFYGNVSDPYNPLLCQWLWGFGDNSTSVMPSFTIHNYKNPGYYNLTLRVKYKNLVAYDTAKVYVFLQGPPNLTLDLQTLCFPGIHALINNPGPYNATHLNWSINVTLGPLKMREKTIASGIIDNVGNHSTREITSKYFFGFRLIRVDIVVTPENFMGGRASFNALKIGPFTINLGKIS